MIRVTLTAVTRRHMVLAAKAALVGGLGLAAGTVAVLAVWAAGTLILGGLGTGCGIRSWLGVAAEDHDRGHDDKSGGEDGEDAGLSMPWNAQYRLAGW